MLKKILIAAVAVAALSGNAEAAPQTYALSIQTFQHSGIRSLEFT